MIHIGNCLHVMPTMDASSVDAIVTDPPYGLGFMGKEWDHGVPGVEFWKEALRVAKPGAHLVAFGGTRTFHRLVCAIEDAGWEIRDSLMWVYGSGFPKSLDVSKAIDKAAGVERTEVLREGVRAGSHPDGDVLGSGLNAGFKDRELRAPATPAAERWQGWGTALKPAWEPIILARKPLTGTVAANVQVHGTGGLNIDGCRVEGAPPSVPQPDLKSARKAITGFDSASRTGEMSEATGRWPANVLHDGSDEVVAMFPDSDGSGPARALHRGVRSDGDGWGMQGAPGSLADAGSGSAARFFYCAKASAEDRNEGLEEFDLKAFGMSSAASAAAAKGEHYDNGDGGVNRVTMRKNIHPTVKPTELMRWLCRLVTPPGGLVLDPFTGSGSTGRAAIMEGMRFVGIELSPEYAAIAEARCKIVQPGLTFGSGL